MISTPSLIESLVATALPVRPLRPPLHRATLWLTFSLAMVAAFGGSHPLRYDIVHCLRQPLWLAMCMGALATAILAAASAFALSVPGRSQRWALLPIPPLAVWVLAITTRDTWVGIERDALGWSGLADILATVVLLTVPLSVTLAVMLRHSAMLHAASVSLLGGLAVAGIAGAALSIFQPLHASVWLIVSSSGVAAVFALASVLLGPRLLMWTYR